MKDKRTNVGYGKGMASGGMSGGRGARRSLVNTFRKASDKGPMKGTRMSSPYVFKQTRTGSKVSKPFANEMGKRGVSSSSSAKSVSSRMSKAPAKPSSSKMSSRYAGKMKAMGKKGK